MKGRSWIIGLVFLSGALICGCGGGYIVGSYYEGYAPLYHYHYYPEATYYEIPLDVVIGVRWVSYYDLESFDLFRWRDYDGDCLVDTNELRRVPSWLEYSPSLQEWRLHPDYLLSPSSYYLVILKTRYDTYIWLFRTVSYYYTGPYYFYYDRHSRKLEKLDSPGSTEDWKKEEPRPFSIDKKAQKEEVKRSP